MSTMTYADEALALAERLRGLGPLPRVRALHLPPPPAPDAPAHDRGEFAALELEDGTLGLAYVLLEGTWAALRQGVPPGALSGSDPFALAAGYRSAELLPRTLGFAALNALTRWLLDRAGWEAPGSSDSLGGLDPQPGETLGMVGFFAPLVPRIRALGARVLALELRADLAGEREEGVRITLNPEALAGCSKVLATGTLLLNGTLDAVLAHCRGAARIALVGPSVGGPPDPLFARGVTLLGGSWITEAAGFVQALRDGAPTRGFARKSALTPADWPGWDALLARAEQRA